MRRVAGLQQTQTNSIQATRSLIARPGPRIQAKQAYRSSLRLCQRAGAASCRGTSRVLAVTASMEGQIRDKNEKYPVMIYAKSYCPFCGQVKGLFNKLQVDYMAVNLDELHEGAELQDSLAGMTGSHTVPQVFIKGEFIGGCDETMQLNNNGQLKEKLEEAGLSVKA